MLILRGISKTNQRYLRLRLTEVTEVLVALIHSAFSSKSVISVYNNKVLHQSYQSLSDNPPPPLNRGDEIRRRVAEHREMVLLSCVAVFPAARDHDLPRFLSCPQILRHTVYIWKVKHHVRNIWNKGSLVMWSFFSVFSVCLTCCREGEDRGLAFPDPLPTHPLLIIGQFAFRTIFMCFLPIFSAF